MRFLIVDDHAVVRKGIIEIVHDFVPDIAPDLTFDEATTAAEALRLAARQRHDLILLDISLPDDSGLATLARLKEEDPERPVLILSVHREDEYVVHAFRNGADGYITKSSAPEELREAVTRILEGDVYISPTVAAALANAATGRMRGSAGHGGPDGPDGLDGLGRVGGPGGLAALLSAREYEVIARLAQGATVAEIARVMNLSGKTVSTYKTRAMRKLNITNQAELLRFAMRHGLSM
ncbi:response regulator transcription factor [Desulfovibrio oxamicus]|uniref:Response regulator transcription factor n=1 Tax=Nitratidesulfovibrio oxamicus TaxID=32016 RepID=A0ABS0J5A3_9BACT|nr:response regulator transcription factor [Nitratidesulfovibrio oxamicus]MBG3877601.1 response regulator transcription factor [Nitratidesulfovibrio oxamicus]